MRGFAITLDAVVALSFFVFAMVLLSGQTYQPRAPGGIYLKQLTLDTATVLEKSGRLDKAMGGDAGPMREVMEATPRLACMRFIVYDQAGAPVLDVTKSGCDEREGLDMQAGAGPFHRNGANYIVRTEAWFRKEGG